MKNLLKKSLIFLILLVMVPLSSFLVACGASPGEDANAVLFVSDKYDETTGKAVFEVDLNVATTLTYKCNPSTASNSVRYTIPIEGQTNSSLNRSRFTFENGVITVDDDEFEQIEIKVTINGCSDQCIVRLKEYPIEIFAVEPEVILNAYGSHTIVAMGKFKLEDDTIETRQIFESDFHYSVISDNETVISVPNSGRLVVCSERQSAGTANITVTILDTTGNSTGVSFKIKVTVVETAKSGFLIFEDYDKFVDDGDSILVDAHYLEANASGEYELKFKVYFISEFNTFIETSDKITCDSSDNKCFAYDNENQIIKIKSNNDVTLQVSVLTNLLKVDGSALKINFTLEFKADI